MRRRQLALLGDWTDRVAKGELPKEPPTRPVGIERNIVVTEWNWNTPTAYVHDGISTDKRNPRVNAKGLIYGSTEASTELLPWVDPINNKAGVLKTEYRDPKTPTTKITPNLMPSPYWGDEAIWDTHTNVHNPMFDEKGRLWLTARIRPAPNPAFCKAGSNHPSAKVYPKDTSNRQTEVYDPKTGKISMIDLCFNTHHLNFDDNGTLWFSAGGPYDVIGWLDMKKWDATHDDAASQGWSPFVIDTNGNGKRDTGWTGLDKPTEPGKDKQIMGAPYGINTAPDGSIYGSILGFPGGVLRFDPKTQLTEYYEVPYKNPKTTMSGFSPRGMGISSDGVVWLALASAVTRRASTAGCARARSTARSQRMRRMSARKAGRSISCLGLSSRICPRHGRRKRRSALRDVGRSARHAWLRQEHADRDREPVGCARRAGGRQVGRAACALSDELLRQRHGRPHRRCDDGLEGQGSVLDLFRARADAYRRRQGPDEQGRALPAPSRSAGALNRMTETIAAKKLSRFGLSADFSTCLVEFEAQDGTTSRLTLLSLIADATLFGSNCITPILPGSLGFLRSSADSITSWSGVI